MQGFFEFLRKDSLVTIGEYCLKELCVTVFKK